MWRVVRRRREYLRFVSGLNLLWGTKSGTVEGLVRENNMRRAVLWKIKTKKRLLEQDVGCPPTHVSSEWHGYQTVLAVSTST